MKIFLTGATGFLGQALVQRLLMDGHVLSAWVRSKAKAAAMFGPRVELVESGGGDAAMAAAIAPVDAIVNLAGEPVFKRWTEANRRSMWASRVDTTRSIAAAIAKHPRRRALVSASAVGYYGDTGEAEVDEDSPHGHGFLADMCVAWEAAAIAAEGPDTRVCRVRIGLVLGKSGGALATMLPLFRLGLGGRLGSGRQYFPWIHIADLVGILAAAVGDPAYTGAVNAVAPGSVTNAEFTRVLGHTLHRPTILPAPAFGLKLAFGASSSALLAGQRVAPRRTLALGHTFAFPALRQALADILG